MARCLLCARRFLRGEKYKTACGRCHAQFPNAEEAALARGNFKAVEIHTFGGARFTMTLTPDPTGWRIAFRGGASEHTIAAETEITSNERMMAHWLGYLENNGVKIEVGQRVSFVANNQWGYEGVVSKVTKTRVTVEFKYRSGRKAAPRTMPIGDVKWARNLKVGV